MLETLNIQDYALIETLEVDFHKGFNILTGETGAGKSIVVGALGLVLGARASSDVVRKGAKQAKISAVFTLKAPSPRLASLLEQQDIELEDNTLLLSRTISTEGRSRAYAEGVMVPVSILRAIGDELVDLHGQHEHQSLLKTERQLALLDSFGNITKQAGALSKKVHALRALQKEIEGLQGDERDRARQIEFLRFEVEEIDAAQLQPNEDADIKERLNFINNAETIFNAANQAYALLYENETGSAVDAISQAQRTLEELRTVDPAFAALTDRLESLRTDAESLAEDLNQYRDQVEFDPEELNTLNQRNAQLGDLKRKYGNSVEEIIAYRNKAEAQLDGLVHHDDRLNELQKQQQTLLDDIDTEANALSKKRKSATKKLDKAVTTSLQQLGMKGAVFSTAIETGPLTSTGTDKVTFQLAANVGESKLPLKQVASGGEISRVMLALKSVFAAADTIPTLIFDEIDAGVGGAVARNVAEKLAELAKSHQVICISHLAQIAAAASAHYAVQKIAANGRTQTGLVSLDKEERISEIARLLDGSVSDVSLGHARALVKELQC